MNCIIKSHQHVHEECDKKSLHYYTRKVVWIGETIPMYECSLCETVISPYRCTDVERKSMVLLSSVILPRHKHIITESEDSGPIEDEEQKRVAKV